MCIFKLSNTPNHSPLCWYMIYSCWERLQESFPLSEQWVLSQDWPVPWHHVTRCQRPAWCGPYCSLTPTVSAEWGQTLWPNYAETSYWPAPSLPPWNERKQTPIQNWITSYKQSSSWTQFIRICVMYRVGQQVSAVSSVVNSIQHVLCLWCVNELRVGNKASREIICDSVYKPEALLANYWQFQRDLCELPQQFHTD